MTTAVVVFAPCLVIAAVTFLYTDISTTGAARLPASMLWGLCLGAPISLLVWLPLLAWLHGPMA